MCGSDGNRFLRLINRPDKARLPTISQQLSGSSATDFADSSTTSSNRPRRWSRSSGQADAFDRADVCRHRGWTATPSEVSGDVAVVGIFDAELFRPLARSLPDRPGGARRERAVSPKLLFDCDTHAMNSDLVPWRAGEKVAASPLSFVPVVYAFKLRGTKWLPPPKERCARERQRPPARTETYLPCRPTCREPALSRCLRLLIVQRPPWAQPRQCRLMTYWLPRLEIARKHGWFAPTRSKPPAPSPQSEQT
jgi:hypothetical protein